MLQTVKNIEDFSLDGCLCGVFPQREKAAAPSSLHFVSQQQRPLALCGVIDQPSTPWGICCCGALRSLTEVFIFMMIHKTPSNTAKLHPAPSAILPPSLKREQSGAQFYAFVLYGVSKAAADVETQCQGKHLAD